MKNNAEVNAINALYETLKLTNTRVTKGTVSELLSIHPDVPSLSALSDTLTELKIKNIAVQIDIEQLFDIPLPAIVYLQLEGNGWFAPVRKVTRDEIEWLHTKYGWIKESLSDFSQKWSNIALLLSPDINSHDPDYTRKRNEEYNEVIALPVASVSLLVLFCLSFIIMNDNMPFNQHSNYYFLLLLKVIGLGSSIMLMWYSVDSKNDFLRKVCQHGSKTSCNNVLKSPASKLSSWLNWAEVGFIYFLGSLILMILHNITYSTSTNKLMLPTVLFVGTALALPYSFWSVYYQSRIAKQWCVLCLTIQILFWLELVLQFEIVNATIKSQLASIQIQPLLYITISFIASIMILFFLKFSMKRMLGFDKIRTELQKVKFDPGYMKVVLEKKKSLPPFLSNMKLIRFGNTTANDTIIMVSNPTCESCREAHNELNVLLANGLDINVYVITAASDDDIDTASKVTKRLLGLPEDTMAQALHDWFKMGDGHFDEWSTKYSNYNESEATLQHRLYLRWLGLSDITVAPTLFMNGAEIPKSYTTQELSKIVSFSSKSGVGQLI